MVRNIFALNGHIKGMYSGKSLGISITLIYVAKSEIFLSANVEKLSTIPLTLFCKTVEHFCII